MVIVGSGDQKASPRWYAIDTCIAIENLVLARAFEVLEKLSDLTGKKVG